MKAIQDLYPADFAHCYGCGRLNEQGLHIRSEWTGEESVARFRPRAEHVALPGFVYGGLLASLIDCHSIGTAAAAFMQVAGGKPGVDPSLRFVTASLEVQFLKPTPMGPELVITARPVEVGQRKVIVESTLAANGVACVRGRVVAVPIPANMIKPKVG
ncbi:MAG: PaaI family thioesterase [Gemmatimonadetes bacterium]|nr:PaaI family thioesterase [Gemmatimonadota bacterium]